MNRRWAMACAAMSGLSVALGAFGAHGLKNALANANVADAAARLAWWDTAAKYQMSHSLALGLVAVLSHLAPSRAAHAAGALFLIGTALFSGSLYVMALTELKLGVVTPLGGLAYLCGWACCFAAATRLSR